MTTWKRWTTADERAGTTMHRDNDIEEVIVKLADGWELRSGSSTDDFTSGEWVRLVRPDGSEYLYWDNEEWQADPILVMGAIINSAAGLIRVLDEDGGREDPRYGTCDECGRAITPDERARLDRDTDFVEHHGHLIRSVKGAVNRT